MYFLTLELACKYIKVLKIKYGAVIEQVKNPERGKAPVVSVIMAVYRIASAKELDSAVSSILGQTFPDLELVICSDGADGQTFSLLEKWHTKDSRVKVTRNVRNLGAGAARNRAAHLASGQYIAIMDADDVAAPIRLAQQLDFLKSNPQFDFVGSRGAYFSQEPGDRPDGYWYVARPAPEDFLMTLPFVHASLMFRREAFFAAGGYRELKRVTRSEDYDLLLRLYALGRRGANLSEVLYFIRMDEAALKRRKYRYRFFECAVKLEGFFKLGLMPIGIIYGLKPLLVGLIPDPILNGIKRRYYNRRSG